MKERHMRKNEIRMTLIMIKLKEYNCEEYKNIIETLNYRKQTYIFMKIAHLFHFHSSTVYEINTDLTVIEKREMIACLLLSTSNYAI